MNVSMCGVCARVEKQQTVTYKQQMTFNVFVNDKEAAVKWGKKWWTGLENVCTSQRHLQQLKF